MITIRILLHVLLHVLTEECKCIVQVKLHYACPSKAIVLVGKKKFEFY